MVSGAREGTENLAKTKSTAHGNSFAEHVGYREGGDLWLSFHI